MNSKYKKAVLICPATINAMEDKNTIINIQKNINNFLKYYNENDYSKKEEDDNLKRAYDIFSKFGTDHNTKLPVDKFLNEKEMKILHSDYMLSNKKYLENIKNNKYFDMYEAIELKKYIDLIIQKEDNIIKCQNSIIEICNYNQKNLFQNNKCNNYNLYGQMNNICRNLYKLDITKKLDDNWKEITIDENFKITNNNSTITCINNNFNNIKLKIFNNYIQMGNDKGYFEINLKKENSKINCGSYIKYIKKGIYNNDTVYYFIKNLKTSNETEDFAIKKFNKKKNLIDIKIDKVIGEINKSFIKIKDNESLCYYDCNSSFIISAEYNKNIPYIISSSENRIKISLKNNKNVLIFNLFIDNINRNNFEFSYFKNIVNLVNNNGIPIFIFNDDGDIFRLLNEKPYIFHTKDLITNAIFLYNDIKIDCFLRGKISSYIYESTFNRNIFYKNLNKEKDIIITFNDNIKYDHFNRIFIDNNNNNNNTLYNLDDNYYITYLDNFLGINFKFNAYNKIKITDKKNNIINFEKYNKKNIALENLKKSYDDFLSKTEIFREYFNILTKLYKEEIEKVDNNDIVNNYTIDQICRIYEKLISENNNDDNKNEINENIILNKTYSTDDILYLLKNCNHLKNNIINSVNESENKKNYKIKFVNDIIVNEESLKNNLIDKNDKINQNILKLLNNSEDNITLIEYLYKISKGIIPTYKETLKGNLESIIHIYYNNKLRLFFKYDHINNIAEVYEDLTHTKKGIEEN